MPAGRKLFSVFHCVKVSFGSLGVFQRANSHSQTRVDEERCYAMFWVQDRPLIFPI